MEEGKKMQIQKRDIKKHELCLIKQLIHSVWKIKKMGDLVKGRCRWRIFCCMQEGSEEIYIWFLFMFRYTVVFCACKLTDLNGFYN